MIEDINIRVLPHEAASDKAIVNAVSKAIHIETECVNQWKIIRRSIDARQRQVIVNLTVRVAHGDDKCIPINAQHTLYKNVANAEHHIIIIGAGPAGLFAALKAIELGIRPIILERGNDVDNRRKDLVEISRNGNVNPNSNYCFGEGGAGAYSDGKLFTRSKKRGSVEHILQILHQHGASDYLPIDTTLTLSHNVSLNISRNPEIYGNVKITLWDQNKEQPATGVELSICGINTTTDENGVAQFSIPLNLQDSSYVVKSSLPLQDDSILMPCGESTYLFIKN